MCGIAGAINAYNGKKIAAKAIGKIRYRGIDDYGFYFDKNINFGHCLHSVVGNRRQPLVKDEFVFGANCEIYNWRELAVRYKIKAENDAELLFEFLRLFLKNRKINDIGNVLINQLLSQLDGVFSFFLFNKKQNYTLLARDVIGEKPLWFNYNGKSLTFASEKKALSGSEELNPRKVIVFDDKKNKLVFLNQNFFEIEKQDKDIDLEKSKKTIKDILTNAIKKRIPDKNLGLLFSGGIDSTFLAFMLKKLDVAFTAYITASEEKKEAVETAKRISKKLGFKLKIIKIDEKIIKNTIPIVIELIESKDPIKVEVGATLYLALKEAKKDKLKVIFSGIGSDDVFGGYKRMLMHSNINEDSLSNLRRLYERDLYRDDALAMKNNIELRQPYLDLGLVRFMLKIPGKYKFGAMPKQLLRDIAVELGMPKEFQSLKKHAAQYSSGVSKIISKMLKNEKTKFKGEYFSKLSKIKNTPLGVLFSSGKDSCYAMHIQHRLNYPIKCLISIESNNKDSFMFHTPTINMVKYQAKALGMPLVIGRTLGEKEKELSDLKKTILKAKKKYKIQGIVAGALYSNYQRTRIEKICDELNLKCYSPLWHVDQGQYMRNLVNEGFEFIITAIAADGLDESWLGRKIGHREIDELVKLNKKNGLNIAGEGGEFESLVLNAPMFTKKIRIVGSKKIVDRNSGRLVIDKAKIG